MILALVAAAAMLLTDVAYTVMTMAQAAGRGWLAGAFDAVGWIVGITTTTISVTALAGHSFAAKAWVVVLVGGANIVGTQLGELTGKRLLRYLRVETVETLDVKVDELERRVDALEAK